jgi:predicted transcriptional regulator
VDLAKHLGVTSSAISKMLSQSKDVKNREELLNKILKEIKESHCITDAVVSDSFVL